MELLGFERIVQFLGGCGRGDGVFFFGPGAQVDLLAALGAEWTEFVRFDPLDFFGTGRAAYDSHGKTTFNI
jgi:hypothetical protein